MSLFISYYNMKITKREGEYIRKYMNLLIFSFVKSSILILLFLYFFLFLFYHPNFKSSKSAINFEILLEFHDSSLRYFIPLEKYHKSYVNFALSLLFASFLKNCGNGNRNRNIRCSSK